MRLLILLFAIPIFLSAGQIGHTIAHLESPLQIIVGGKVNAISGTYVEAATDMVIPSIVPFEISRVYQNSPRKDRDRSGNWIFNYLTIGELDQYNQGFQFKHFDENGTFFHGDRGIEFNNSGLSNTYSKGETNLGRGQISGKTNITNTKCHIGYGGFCLEKPDREERYYSKALTKHFTDHPPKDPTYTVALEKILFFNQAKIEIKSKGKAHETQISAYSSDQKLVGTIDFFDAHERDFIKHPVFLFRAQDEREMKYKFEIRKTEGKRPIEDGGWYGLLREVTGTGKIPVIYNYDYNSPRLVRRTEPNNRYLEIDYLVEKPAHFYVKALYEPAGNNPNKVKTWKFNYFKSERRTDAYDALKQKTSYYYNEDYRPTKIEYFDEDGFSDQMIWGNPIANEQCNLTTRILSNIRDYKAKSYVYDGRGNPLVEIVWGNFSGTNFSRPSFGTYGEIYPNGAEGYEKTYTYDDLHNKKSEKFPNGLEVKYEYIPGTEQLSFKQVEGLTTTYSYHPCGSLHEQIEQDGSNYKLTTKHFPKLSFPCYGFDESIEEYYDETLLKKTTFEYNRLGLVTKKSVYGSDGILAYTEKWDYDDFGNCVLHIGRLGEQISRKFDGNNNLIEEVGPHPSYCKTFKYDYMNRGYYHEEFFSNWRLSTVKKYDTLGRCTDSLDFLGNHFHYEHDRFGRVIKTVQPTGAVILQKYDAFNNVIEITDAMGHKVTTHYNAYDKPYEIIYEDGSKETTIYNLDGTVKEHIAKNGMRSTYQYDLFQRLIRHYENNTLIEKRDYDGTLLKKITNAEGVETLFTYDRAARLIGEEFAGSKTTYEYDTLGRRFRTLHWDGTKLLSIDAVEYDVYDRISSSWVEDEQGQRFLERSISYDYFGNINKEVMGDRVVFYEYDPHGRLLYKIDADGSKTDYFYEFNHQLKKTEIQHNGLKSVEIYDASGYCTSIEKFDPYNNRLSLSQFIYDLSGNLKQEIHENEVITYEYNSLGLKKLMLEPGKRTEFTYIFGELDTVTKPDGVILSYTYDKKGRLHTLISSDKTVSYEYIYNKMDQIIHLIDHVNQCTVDRTYDKRGNLSTDSYSNHTNTFFYDALNRKTSIEYPDRSTSNFTYNAFRLTQVDRKGLIHSYDQFDPYGMTTQETFMDHTTQTKKYDSLNRITEIGTVTDIHYDPFGHLTDRKVSNTLETFTFNHQGQLLTEPHFSYDYDSIFNRTRKNTEIYSINAQNQISSDSSHNYSYDPNGNLKERFANGSHQILEYDALNRLTKVTINDQIYHYYYDGFNRRLIRQTPTETHLFWFQESLEIGLESNNILLEFRLLGIGLAEDVGATIAIELSATLHIPHHDQIGNIISLDNDTYATSSFGEEPPDHHYQSPWRFSSKRIDPETGLVNFGRRFYDPLLGRFISPDPTSYSAGPNLYALVNNSPLTHFDPYGLYSWSDFTSDVSQIFDYVGDAINTGITASVDFFTAHTRYSISRGCELISEFYDPSYSGDEKPGLHRIHGEKVEGVTIILVNGMLNTFKEAEENALKFYSELGGIEVNFLFNPTQGFGNDFIRAGTEVFSHKETQCVSMLRDFIEATFSHSNDNLVIAAFSEGVAITRNASERLLDIHKERLWVEAYGPSCYIYESTLKNVTHIVSDKDLVASIDSIGKYMNRSRTITLKSNRFFHDDHSFMGKTYSSQFKSNFNNDLLKIHAVRNF